MFPDLELSPDLGRYAHLAADPVKAAAQDVAGRIATAMKSDGRRGAVTPFSGN